MRNNRPTPTCHPIPRNLYRPRKAADQPVVSVLYFENLSSSEEFSWVARRGRGPAGQ
jgi:hypothetical protein